MRSDITFIKIKNRQWLQPKVRRYIWVPRLHSFELPMCPPRCKSISLPMLIPPHTINSPRLYCQISCTNVCVRVWGFRVVLFLHSRTCYFSAILHNESGLVSDKTWLQSRCIHSQCYSSNLGLGVNVTFQPHGVLRSKGYTSLVYAHIGNSDKDNFRLFSLTAFVLLWEETDFGSE